MLGWLLVGRAAQLDRLVGVAEGSADSLSGWVNDALHRQADHDRRLRALDDFLAAYEAEHGEITEAEVADAARRARTHAVVIRGRGVA